MKTKIKYMFKVLVSGFLALGILNIFCVFYHNPPYAVEQPDKFTNYHFEPKFFWSTMTEGFGFGRTNNIGYNSIDDINYHEPVFVYLGSSQTEAFQVPQAMNYVSLVQKRFFSDEDSTNDFPCVNLGISSHYFNVSVSNFEALTKSFENIRCAVIEARSLVYTETELEKMLVGAYHKGLEKQSMLYQVMRKIPYIRMLKSQYEKIQRKGENKNTVQSSIDYYSYEDKLDAVLKKISSIAQKQDFKLIILYHNPIAVDGENRAFREDNPVLSKIFRRCCNENDVGFIDVTEAFVDHYNQTYEMPYGFQNTKFGTGHLNKVGHRIIAETLYTEMCEMLGEQNNGI